ncbi:DUF3152 domain-containing protein [Ornithinimicrobium sediminis]|uniref:DUF3152 domain-containing protein n=1 Tax=Ornithinimicrobium sediminis TaxID=2904603 RepID=UPI001E52F183|nr:DUF3152 domain-containing protein [Ornithinimicrobium sediminis]MCE0488215.1 DUF3152 domain-containing protein [Ornithinimicrobium sediminis]
MRRICAKIAAVALTTFGLTALPAGSASAHTFSYSIETSGAVSSDVGTFAAITRSNLTDGRGWILDGGISYTQVSSDADPDMRIVLATPAAVDAAAPGCSATWSCRVGDRVLINEERWNTATASWTGDLHSYRHYVINHEVGHWLGLGHWGCPGSGAAAPVMQQQSISLDGCEATTWPLWSEKRAVAEVQGVSSFLSLLEWGDRGPAVAEWQAQLNQVRSDDIAVDGVFGPITEQATIDFQRSQGILVDGVVGPQTRSAMRGALQ